MVKLTYTLKRKWETIVINQTGRDCFHCKCENTELNPLEWGHLNGNDNDSRPENLAFMCKTCNNKQKFNYDMQILANEQLQKNEKAVLTRERMLADTGTTKELTSQQEISKINKRITKQFIQEQTINNQELILRDVVNAIVDICDDNNGTGSQSAVYRYIDSLTNPYTGKYTLTTNSEGKTVIRRRTENWKTMVYRKPHLDCSEGNCQSYSAYIRVRKKWIKAGEYNSKCRTFTPFDQVRTYDQIKKEDLRKQIESNSYLREMLGLKE